MGEGDTELRCRAQDSKRVYFHPRVEMPGSANKAIAFPVIFESQVANNFLVYQGHTCSQNLYIVYLKLKFNWASCIFSSKPTISLHFPSSYTFLGSSSMERLPPF